MSCLRVGPYGQPGSSAVKKRRGGQIHRHAKSLNVVRPIFQAQIPAHRTPFPKPLQSDEEELEKSNVSLQGLKKGSRRKVVSGTRAKIARRGL
jgi:hypothetical protein